MKSEHRAEPIGDFLLTRRRVIDPYRTIGDEIFDIAERLGVFEPPLPVKIDQNPAAGIEFTSTEEKVLRRLVHIEPGNSSSIKALAADTGLSRDWVKSVLENVGDKIGVRGKLRIAVAVERSGIFS